MLKKLLEKGRTLKVSKSQTLTSSTDNEGKKEGKEGRVEKERMVEKERKGRGIFFDRVAKYSMYVLVALLPLFFLPTASLDLGQIKIGLFVLTITISAISLVISALCGGKIKLLSLKVLIPIISISLITFLSAFFSTSYKDGFMGLGTELDSWYLISGFLLCVILIVSIVNTKERIFKVFSLFWMSFGISALFQVIRILTSAFGLVGLSKLLSLGGLFDLPSINTIGTWADFDVVAGVVAISLAVTLDLVPLKNSIKKTFWVLFGISTLLSIIMSFVLTGFDVDQVIGIPKFVIPFISVVGLVSLLFSILQLRIKGQNVGKDTIKFPIANFILVILGLLFMVFPIVINKEINYLINVPNESLLNIRPDLTETYDVSKAVLTTSFKNSLIGSGPHGFYISQNQFRPAYVNNSTSWNTDFQSGVGYLPTFLTNNGILGFLLWMISLIMLFYLGVKRILKDKNSVDYVKAVTLVSALLLWINALVNTSGPVVIILTFIMSGLLMASLVLDGNIKTTAYFLYGNKIKSLVNVVAVIVFVTLSVCLAYVWAERARGSMYSSEAMQMIYSKDVNISVVPKAIELIKKSYAAYPSDIYARGINNLDLIQVNYDVSSDPANQVLQSGQKIQLNPSTSAYLDESRYFGWASVNANPNDFKNWLQLGSTMQTIALVAPDETAGQDAGKIALQSFIQAVNLAKNHPLPYYSLANLYILSGQKDYAKVSLERALSLKPDFQEANDLYQGLMNEATTSAPILIKPDTAVSTSSTSTPSKSTSVKPVILKNSTSKSATAKPAVKKPVVNTLKKTNVTNISKSPASTKATTVIK